MVGGRSLRCEQNASTVGVKWKSSTVRGRRENSPCGLGVCTTRQNVHTHRLPVLSAEELYAVGRTQKRSTRCGIICYSLLADDGRSAGRDARSATPRYGRGRGHCFRCRDDDGPCSDNDDDDDDGWLQTAVRASTWTTRATGVGADGRTDARALPTTTTTTAAAERVRIRRRTGHDLLKKWRTDQPARTSNPRVRTAVRVECDGVNRQQPHTHTRTTRRRQYVAEPRLCKTIRSELHHEHDDDDDGEPRKWEPIS